MTGMVEYFLNKATESDIINHLLAGDADFVQALIERINIAEYGKKIYNEAVRFEAWAGDELVGLVAAYCNDKTKRIAYITNVSVLNEWQGKGIAVQLIGRCVEYAEKLGMHCISLEVVRRNETVIGLYEKCGFVVSDASDSSITMNLFFEKGENHAK